MVESCRLSRCGWLVGFKFFLAVWREQNCPMSVSLKVYPNIVVFCGMVEVLYSGGNTFDREALSIVINDSARLEVMFRPTSDRYFVDAPLV